MQHSERDETISKAYLVPGWMWPTELGWLYDTAVGRTDYLEVGSFCGKSLLTVCGGMSTKRGRKNALAVDPGGFSALGGPWTDAVLAATITEISKSGLISPELWRMLSVDAMRACHARGRTFDFIFIDGCHAYAEVKADIEGWLPFLRQGGVMSGHDYWPRNVGVMEAVEETLPGKVEVVSGTRIWMTRKE